MSPRPGWAKRQIAQTIADMVQWPDWMRREAKLAYEVRPSEYALRVAPEPKVQREKIAAGVITASIRMGWRRGYDPGASLQLCCPFEVWCVMADIESRRYCLMHEVTAEEWQVAGYVGMEEHLAFIRTFPGYEHANPDSEVTIIRWKNARGKLVERYREHMERGGGQGGIRV